VFTLHPESGVPIYRQLVEQVRRLVAGGQLLPGAELPSVREVAQVHTVNPMTVSKAYALLEAEGLLERNRGKPMTIAAGRRPQQSLTQRLRQIEPQAQQLVTAARQLELTAKDVTMLINRKWGESDAD
jgi:GntR family transcriptional regulator